ncbi:MAG: phosphoribosylformylglycinamidine synthase subunit PurS [Candidatus Omnitrophica bacterium]|nr:phosphoribosylformylglycinamidine synthase subunit PurS [Candidatus Omnitrophota bacterium]
MKARVYITLKKSVLDPQGETVKHALASLGFNSIEEVRMGKYVELNLNTASKKQAEQKVQQMCEQLLANPVIEEFRYEVISR